MSENLIIWDAEVIRNLAKQYAYQPTMTNKVEGLEMSSSKIEVQVGTAC